MDEANPNPTSETSDQPQEHSSGGIVDQSKAHPRRKLFLFILLLLLAGGAGGWLYMRHSSSAPAAHKSKPTPAVQKTTGAFCFTRLDKLVCVDQKGTRTRHDLPSIGGSTVDALSPSPDGTQFLAKASFDIWILDDLLKPVKQIKVPAGYTASPDGQFAWARDGKSALLMLGTHGTQSQIFRYTLATDKLTQVTVGNTSWVQHPHQLADGRILYWSGNPEQPILADPDGSRGANLPELSQLPNTANLSSGYAYYDQAGDTFFYLYHSTTQATILKWPAAQLGSNKAPTRIPVEFAGSDEFVASFDASTLIYQHDNEIDFVDGTTGKLKIKSVGSGTPVGVLTVRKDLPQTSPQAEDKYERIANLSSAPADFQTYIKGQFDKADAGCTAPGAEERFYVDKVVRDQFASVEENCEPGADYLYAKQKGQWQEVFSAQDEPECSVINKYAFTKEILPDCYDTAKAKSVPNPNP